MFIIDFTQYMFADFTHYVFIADSTYFVFFADFTYYVFNTYSSSRKVNRRQTEEREKRESDCATIDHLQLPLVASSHSCSQCQPTV